MFEVRLPQPLNLHYFINLNPILNTPPVYTSGCWVKFFLLFIYIFSI